MDAVQTKTAIAACCNATWTAAMRDDTQGGLFHGAKRHNIMLIANGGSGKTSLVWDLVTHGDRWVDPAVWDHLVEDEVVDPDDVGDIDVIELNSTLNRPEDRNGVPDFTHPLGDDSRELVWRTFGELNRLRDAVRPTICFFDDFLMGVSDAMKAADLKIIRGVLPNGQRVSPWVNFVATTNDITHGAAVRGNLDPSNTSFHMQVKVEIPAKQWCNWARANGIHPGVISFIDLHPEWLNVDDCNTTLERRPCQRLWQSVSDVLYMFEHEPRMMDVSLMASAGEKAGPPLIGHLAIWRVMANPQDAIADPHEFPIPSEITGQYAMAIRVATYAANDGGETTINAAIILAERMSDFGDMLVSEMMRVNESALRDASSYGRWSAKNAVLDLTTF